jgi:uncharacterized protein (DUF1810 family)
LGKSEISKFYAIQNTEEARRYLKHSVLGKRLIECTQAVLDIDGFSISEIIGIDDLKLKSSMTLFASISGKNSVFEKVIDKYFQGEMDILTLNIIENQNTKGNDQ